MGRTIINGSCGRVVKAIDLKSIDVSRVGSNPAETDFYNYFYFATVYVWKVCKKECSIAVLSC